MNGKKDKKIEDASALGPDSIEVDTEDLDVAEITNESVKHSHDAIEAPQDVTQPTPAASRTKSSIVNILSGVFSYLVILVLKFVFRVVLIRTLGDEYIGLNGLFANIISIFSIAELGLGTGIMAILYKPLHDNDIEKIKSIIGFTKKIFIIIGIIILAVGLVFTPFIGVVINDTTIDINQIRIYFIVYLIYTCITYFNYHKILLLLTAQKSYIEKNVMAIVNIIVMSLSIGFLYLFNEYIYYLILLAVGAFIQNLIVSIFATKKYPYLKQRGTKPFESNEKKELTGKIYAVSVQKIGATLVTSTDNILISAFISLAILGVYSNYSLIMSSIMSLCWQIKNGLIASVGNLWKDKPKEYVRKVFERINFLFFWLFSFCTACLLCLSDPFISLIFGNDFIIDRLSFFLIIIVFYFEGTQLTVNGFKETQGLFVKDKYLNIVRAVINLVVSIVLVQFIGLSGIFIGTISSFILTTFWVEPFVLFKYGFKERSKKYYLKTLIMLLITVLVCAVTYLSCYWIPWDIWGFVFRCMICLAVPNIILFFTTFFSNESKYYRSYIQSRIFKRKKM